VEASSAKLLSFRGLRLVKADVVHVKFHVMMRARDVRDLNISISSSTLNTISSQKHKTQPGAFKAASPRPSGLEAMTMARFIPNHIPHLPFRIPFFRIFYSTTYTILYFITLLLLGVNPGSMLYTAFDKNAYQYVFEISGAYVLTILLTLFIYLSRLYTNRTVMAAVGKSYIPVEEGEVGEKVRKMIVRALERSAIIAIESRPRDLSAQVSTATSDSSITTNEKPLAHRSVGRVIKVDPENPPWGRVEHAGWSAPSKADTHLAPHVQFRTVIHELPNLVEARAVSLAPADPYSTPTASQSGGITPADPAIVELLRRGPHADLRNYLGHLSKLGLVNPPRVGEDFLWRYERARFSCIPLPEAQFELLMESFAMLLTGMQELSPTVIGQARANRFATDSTDASSISGSSLSSYSSRSTSIAGSVRQARRDYSASRAPSFYTSMTGASFDTAPQHSPLQFRSPSMRLDATPRPGTADTLPTPSTMRRESSRETFGSVGSVLHNLPDDVSVSSGSSSRGSLRSRSLRSYAGSVIRHSPARRPDVDRWPSPG